MIWKRTVLFILIFTSILTAQIYTDVSGGQNGTWTKANSPYRIEGDIRVGPDSTLVIEAGVTVYFHGAYDILIYGTLNAQGTINDSIIFKHTWLGSKHGCITFDSLAGALLPANGILEYCHFQDGRKNLGGAIWINNSSPTIRHCTFTNNEALFGGAVYVTRESQALIECNMFYNNSCSFVGGAIGQNGHPEERAYHSDPVIRNNIIFNNQSTGGEPYGGGGISIYKNFHGELSNNIVYNNAVNGYGGGIMIYKSTDNDVSIKNCIVYGNSAVLGDNQISNRESATLSVTYCDVQNGYTGTGNINSNPDFIDASNYDFHLSENSPCIDVGTNTGNPATDFDNNPTEQDGDNDLSNDADMGAYEFLQEVHSFSSNSTTDYQLNTFEGSPTTIASITLSGYSSGTGDITVNCFTKSSPLNAPGGSKSIKRWYRISESGDLDYSDNATLLLYYSTDEFDLSNISSESGLTLWKYDSGSWVDKGGTVSIGSNYVELTGVSKSELFGDWAFSNMNDSPLPVFLSNLMANIGDNKVTLKWETSSEIENQGFIILRTSEEYGNYQEIDSYILNDNLKGAGNSSSPKEYSFNDYNVINGQKYWYKLVDVSLNGIRTEHGPVFAIPNKSKLQLVDSTIPESIMLKQNYPNPFNPSTKIDFSIPEENNSSANISLIVYDLLGRKIKVLYNGYISPGNYEVEWNGLNELNQQVTSGIYVYRLVLGQLNYKSRKMMLLR
jgi:hypothetical protein